METKTTPVVLLLADISGYTQFMLSHHKAPIHGQMIIAGLFETLIRNLSTTMGHSTGLIREQCPVW